tara:strand:- start:49 stop:261 length:213 start_codon:yes stop_codon:yes gene_type:complete
LKVDKNKNLVDWPFGKKNYILFTVSLLTIIFGYFLMWSGEVNSFQSVKVAPKILTIGYLVLIPLSILYKD